MNNLVALLIAIGVVGVASIGILSNVVDLELQAMGVFPSISFFDSFSCECENPNNPGEFGTEFCDFNDPKFDPNNICPDESVAFANDASTGFSSRVWVSSLDESQRSYCGWPTGYSPTHKFADPAYFFSPITIKKLPGPSDSGFRSGVADSGARAGVVDVGARVNLPGQIPREGGLITINDPTLLESLDARGGGVNKLARESVAAMLNAAYNNVDYPYTVNEIQSLTQQAIADKDYTIANEFAKLNVRGGPLTCR